MHEACLIIIHDPGPGIEPGTFGLADECSTTELTLLLMLHVDLKKRHCRHVGFKHQRASGKFPFTTTGPYGNGDCNKLFAGLLQFLLNFIIPSFHTCG